MGIRHCIAFGSLRVSGLLALRGVLTLLMVSSCWPWLEPIPRHSGSLNEGTNCWMLQPALVMSVCRQSGKPRVVIWTKCHCLEIFLLMCFFSDDKSQACTQNNNTKYLTAFLTIVWHSVCLIIVSITHTIQLLESIRAPVNEGTGLLFPGFSAPVFGLHLNIIHEALKSCDHVGIWLCHPTRHQNRAIKSW